MSPRPRILFLAGVAAACAVAPPLVLTGAGGPLRVAATLAVLCLAPGAALTGASRPAALSLGLVLATSLGCSAVVAQTMLAAGLWGPRGALCVLALLSLPAVAIRLYRASERVPEWLSERER